MLGFQNVEISHPFNIRESVCRSWRYYKGFVILEASVAFHVTWLRDTLGVLGGGSDNQVAVKLL